LPPESTNLTIDTAAAAGTSDISLQMTREDDKGKQVFKHDSISLSAGDQAMLEFGNWSNNQSLPLVVTHAGNQTTETLTDQGG
jgi:hypothetical protein